MKLKASIYSIICLILHAISVDSTATTFTVGEGQNFANPAQITWSSIKAGDSIVIYPGTYTAMGTGNSMTVNNVTGTSANRILIYASSLSNRPILKDGINISGSKFVTISGLEVTRDATSQLYAAIVVQNSSSDVILSNLKVRDAYVGVTFSGAVQRNRIDTSEVYGNKNHGITVGSPSINGDASNFSFISGNNVHENGGHGIDIESSYWRIEQNTVTKNGSAYGGTSGIHMFSASDSSGLDCDYNQVFYNYVTGQIDGTLADGNGIQIDHFCDSNQVGYNVTWGNAGAGISLYVGKNNAIVANTSYGNQTDRHRLVYSGVIRGEIILASDATICTNVDTSGNCLGTAAIPAGRTSGNLVYDNIVYSLYSDLAGINATNDFISASRNTNTIYQNFYYNSVSGPNLIWGSTAYYTASNIDVVTGLVNTGGGNLAEAPNFLNSATPAKGSDGLKLKSKPSKVGRTVAPVLPDILGVMPTTGNSYFGAYLTK